MKSMKVSAQVPSGMTESVGGALCSQATGSSRLPSARHPPRRRGRRREQGLGDDVDRESWPAGRSITGISPVFAGTLPSAASRVTRGMTPSRRLRSSTTASGRALSTESFDELAEVWCRRRRPRGRAARSRRRSVSPALTWRITSLSRTTPSEDAAGADDEGGGGLQVAHGAQRGARAGGEPRRRPAPAPSRWRR